MPPETVTLSAVTAAAAFNIPAGAARQILDPDAIPVLYRLTHGVARHINRLCDLAPLIGFAEERRTFDAAQLEAVCQELVTVVPE